LSPAEGKGDYYQSIVIAVFTLETSFDQRIPGIGLSKQGVRMKKSLIVILFVIAALYDGLLGAAFLFRAEALFEWLEVPPPNHFGYVHFPAALLLVFALMYLAVAINPQGNRNLIPYGMLLKVSYCGTICYHWFTAGVPAIWKPFVFFDLIFLVLFAWAYHSLGKRAKRAPSIL
jgi:hypothetical protein